jgi:hypothetical protein
MIRTLNFAFIAITCLVCLGVYRTAEKARVEQVELKITRAEIAKETAALSILGAEWARVTEPKRIQALVQHHLDLSDKPGVELSSLSQLPPKNPPLASEGDIRSAKAVVPQAPAPQAPAAGQQPLPDVTFASAHTGT